MKKSSHHNELEQLRHSTAHLLAHAILELYPDTLLTIGPATEWGFFYDVQPINRNFTQDNLPLIEKKMHEIAQRNYAITGKQVSKKEARALFAHNRFKLELIDTIPDETVGIYTQGNFSDLCRGGHVESLGEIQHFALTGISGSYWRADRNGIPLQRISGVAFPTQKELDNHFLALEEAKKYDHRTLGVQLDLFSFHDEAPGSVFFHDYGVTVFNELIAYSRSMQQEDYQEIKTPIINHESLYKISGHYDNYQENAFIIPIEKINYWVRPMNCPSCVLYYKERPHSYRELPLRIAEYGICHRYELSGVLHGLFRVRTFTMDDAHIFCTPEQLETEIIKVLELSLTMYRTFGFEKPKIALSTRPEKSLGTEEQWTQAITALKTALDYMRIPYAIQEGEGAFYGPKIEIKIEDRMGREWQCGTVQVDFNLPECFDLFYVASDQSRRKPVMIHRAILGSVERFFGILLEHYKGHLPFWLAPVQIRILTITDDQIDYAKDIYHALKKAKIRASLDISSDQISAKIKSAQLAHVPWMLIIGKKEKENNTIALRHSNGAQEFGLSLATIIERAHETQEQKK